MVEPARDTADRLPWLTEVPRSAPPPATAERRMKLPLLAFLLGALFALIAVGSFWLGSRPSSTVDVAAQEAERPGMSAQVDTSAQAEAQAREAVATPVEDDAGAVESQAQSAAPTVLPRATPAQVERQRARPTRQAAAPVRRTPVRRTVSRQAQAPVILQPVVRGRIIQTGAFASRQEAELAWQAMVRKWPYLGTKPRLISPLEVRSTDGRVTQMFRVQLATASQAQSVVICQRLAAAKQSCVVVY